VRYAIQWKIIRSGEGIMPIIILVKMLRHEPHEFMTEVSYAHKPRFGHPYIRVSTIV